LLTLILTGCSSGGGGDDDNNIVIPIVSMVTVSWTANREAGVNNIGGGYTLYHSTTPGFSLEGAESVDLPYESGSTAPTSTTLAMLTGTHYIKIVAYSALNPAGGPASSQLTVTAP
jgi:hypothetical protein